MKHLPSLAFVALSAAVPTAFAQSQCEPVWLSGAPTAGINNEVRRLLPWNDGLVAVGRFTQVGTAPSMGIAYWDNVAWTPLSSVTSGYATDAVVLNGTLFAAAGFTGAPSPGVIRYVNGTWAATGAGLDWAVASLAVHQGEVYAAGSFTRSGSTTVERVARWTGTHWTQVGINPPGAGIRDLISFNGMLIACGSFTTAGGAPAPGIAKWDGVAWSTIPGAQFLSTPLEMAVVDNKLHVMGYSNAQGYLDTFDGSEWTHLIETTFLNMSGGVNYAGSLYIGAADSLITQSGGHWSRTGSLLTSSGFSTIFCLAVHRGVLFMGGYFTSAGGQPASMIARYYRPTVDFNNDGDFATDADIEAFFACMNGDCCPTCSPADFDGDGMLATDGDIEAFFRALSGQCA